MFGISWGEFLVVALVAVIVLGPGKLPEAARTAGWIYGRLNRFMVEARAALKTEFDLAGLSRPLPPSPPAAEPAPDADPDRRA
jgi:sec-independent protein translocase protein TatB